MTQFGLALNPGLDAAQLAGQFRSSGREHIPRFSRFRGPDGHVERALVPACNALNIFAVPAEHSVSMVTPFAPNRRYAITGWLRAGPPPE